MTENNKKALALAAGVALIFLLVKKVWGGPPSPPPETGGVRGFVIGDLDGYVIGAIVTIGGKSTHTTPPNGHYAVDGLMPGDYTLHIEHPLYIPRDIPVTIIANQITYRDIVLYPNVTLP